MTVIFYQFEMKRYKEKLYARKIQRSAEEARKANEAKTRFLFNMSHDIRTPMNAIIGFAHLLSLNLGDVAKCRDYLSKLQGSSKLLLTIINQVLEMARIESGKTVLNMEPMSIRESVATLNTVFELTVGKKKYAAVEPEILALNTRAEALRKKLEKLVQADADAFLPLSAAYGLPKETPEQSAHCHSF